jgi:hypothetical protein
MIKEKINELLTKTFDSDDYFAKFLSSSNFKKRYSIMKGDMAYSIGDNLYKQTFCFFFYFKEYLVETFYCEITGNGVELKNEKLKAYQYPCNDINRADCWEWVDVA